MMRVPIFATSLVLAGCADSSVDNTPEITTINATTSSTSSTPAEETSEADETGSSTSSSSTTTTPLTTAPVVDVGDVWELSPACGQLDVLIVVERSFWTSSLFDSSLESMLGGLAERLDGWSIHVMVVDGRVGSLEVACEEECQDGDCEFAWSEFPCDETGACDWTRGAGLVWASAPTRCLDQQRWVDADDVDAVERIRCLFESATGAGTLDSIASLLAAVSPPLVEGCNAGFLREDAWLMPVIASHGYPVAAGSPDFWADKLLAAKGGEPHVVPVALLDPQILPWDPPATCDEGPGDKTGEYQQLVEILGGVVGSVCANYTPPVLEAADIVAGQCAATPT